MQEDINWAMVSQFTLLLAKGAYFVSYGESGVDGRECFEWAVLLLVRLCVELIDAGTVHQPGILQHFERVPELVTDRGHHVPVGLPRVHDDPQDSITGGRRDVQCQARLNTVLAVPMFDVDNPVGRFNGVDDAAERAGADDGLVDHRAEVRVRGAHARPDRALGADRVAGAGQRQRSRLTRVHASVQHCGKEGEHTQMDQRADRLRDRTHDVSPDPSGNRWCAPANARR